MRSFAGGLLAAAVLIAPLTPAAGQEERRELALELVNEARRAEGLDPHAESFGFALTASGEGRNGAVALTGRP